MRDGRLLGGRGPNSGHKGDRGGGRKDEGGSSKRLKEGGSQG